MQTVILAAGAGTRLRPLTERVPKPMLPVGDRPLVEHVADAAVAAGATDLVLVVGYGADQVRDHFGDGHRGVPVRFAEQSEQAGTADAVQSALPYLDGPFAVLNGDNCYDPADLSELFARAPAVGVHPVPNPSDYGVVAVDGGRVADIEEKPADPPGDLANTGAYAFPAAVADMLSVPVSERGELELTDALARLLDTHDVTPVRFDRWADVGRAWELLEANERALADLTRSVEGTVHPTADLRGDVVVEAGARVDSGVVVEGPVLVESGATVGPNAYVRGPALVSADAHVGHAVEVKNSLLMPRASVPHLSYVGDSILGADANLGAGTQIANLRHDDAPVHLTVKGERVSTGRRKFGAVVGPGAKTGVNTSIAPGVTLGADATTMPGESVTRDR